MGEGGGAGRGAARGQRRPNTAREVREARPPASSSRPRPARRPQGRGRAAKGESAERSEEGGDGELRRPGRPSPASTGSSRNAAQNARGGGWHAQASARCSRSNGACCVSARLRAVQDGVAGGRKRVSPVRTKPRPVRPHVGPRPQRAQLPCLVSRLRPKPSCPEWLRVVTGGWKARGLRRDGAPRTRPPQPQSPLDQLGVPRGPEPPRTVGGT